MINLVNKALNNISNQRTKEIISLRFGLDDGQRKTLEEIGRKYNITRERVRQIEEVAFSDLKKNKAIVVLRPLFEKIDKFLNQEGKVVREERMLSSLTGFNTLHPSRGAVYFALTLGDPYKRFVESDKFYPFWTNSEDSLKRINQLIDSLTQRIEKENRTFSFEQILNYVKEIDRGLNKRQIGSYLDVTKRIGRNNFDQFGLSNWPVINPRGAKDKAYIVLKEQGRPLHFREVADLINQLGLSSNLAQAQTVHNELIKDDRFILIGRGTYALREWGYQPGTIKEVISQVLKENGPLAKNEILTKVLENRLAKENTVLINLQNKEYFARDGRGRYFLIKK